MDFIDKVNSIKEEVLNKPEYKIPINAVITKAKGYTSEIEKEEAER